MFHHLNETVRCLKQMKTKTEKILALSRIIAIIGYYGTIITGVAGVLVLGYMMLFPSPFPEGATHTTKIGTYISPVPLKTLFAEHSFDMATLTLLNILTFICIIRVWKFAKELLDQIDLNNPFTRVVAESIEKMAIAAFWLLISYAVSNYYLDSFMQNLTNSFKQEITMPNLHYPLGVGLIYLISQIFKRGVELQEETELTV